MSDELAQQVPYPALGDLIRWIEAENVPYTIIGGLSENRCALRQGT